jgi:hypothetical protein
VIWKKRLHLCEQNSFGEGLHDMRGLLCRFKQWWQAMAAPQFPELDSMRKEVRRAVHKNRNLTMNAIAESQKAKKVSLAARDSAYDAIARLEEAKKGGKDEGPRVPPIR